MSSWNLSNPRRNAAKGKQIAKWKDEPIGKEEKILDKARQIVYIDDVYVCSHQPLAFSFYTQEENLR